MTNHTARLRLGIAGVGMITRNSHLPAALACDGVRVTALVDPVTERAEELADQHGLAVRVAADVADVVDEVDAMIVASPNDTHAPIALRLADAGVHALVEKPLATSLEEAHRIYETAEAAGTVVAAGYVTRFQNATALLGRLLRERAFGRVKRFGHQFGTNGGWAPLSGYNLDPSTAGGGVLVVSGTHFLDRMLHFWGMPDEVELETDAVDGPEANCVARFTYRREDGPMTGIALYSKTTPLRGGMVMECERGLVRVLEGAADIEWFPAASPHLREVIQHRGSPPFPDDANPFLLQLQDFVESVRSGRAPMVDARHGAASVALLQRLYAARCPIDTNWYDPSDVSRSV